MLMPVVTLLKLVALSLSLAALEKGNQINLTLKFYDAYYDTETFLTG